MVEETQNVPYQLPMHMMGSNILYLTDPSSELHRFELHLRGKMEDAEGNVISIGVPIMNDEGINFVMSSLNSIVHRINMMGHLTNKEIECVGQFYSESVIRHLLVNGHIYNLGDEKRDYIADEMMSFAFFSMKRSWEGGDRKFFKSSFQEIKSTVDSTMKNKGGNILSAINPFNKQ